MSKRKCPFCGAINPEVHAVYTVSVYGIYDHEASKIIPSNVDIDQLRTLAFDCCNQILTIDDNNNAKVDLTIVEPEGGIHI